MKRSLAPPPDGSKVLPRFRDGGFQERPPAQLLNHQLHRTLSGNVEGHLHRSHKRSSDRFAVNQEERQREVAAVHSWHRQNQCAYPRLKGPRSGIDCGGPGLLAGLVWLGSKLFGVRKPLSPNVLLCSSLVSGLSSSLG